MATINISDFRGLSTKISPKLLKDNQAQVATNCVIENGQLKPLQKTTLITDVSEMIVIGNSSLGHDANTTSFGGTLGTTPTAYKLGTIIYMENTDSNYICIQDHTSREDIDSESNWPTDDTGDEYWLPIYVYAVTDGAGTATNTDSSDITLQDTASNGGDGWEVSSSAPYPFAGLKVINTKAGAGTNSGVVISGSSNTATAITHSALSGSDTWETGDGYKFEGYAGVTTVTTDTPLNGGLDVSGSSNTKYLKLHTPDVGVVIWFNVTSDTVSATMDGTTTITVPSDANDYYEAGQTVTGTNIAAGTTVVSVDSTTTLTITPAATGSGTNSVTIGPSATQADPRLNNNNLLNFVAIQIDVPILSTAADISALIADATTGCGVYENTTADSFIGLWSDVSDGTGTVAFTNKYTGTTTAPALGNTFGNSWAVAETTPGVNDIGLEAGGSVESMYKLNDSWLQFSSEVRVVQSSVPDNNYRIYYTGDQFPKQTNYTKAVSGQSYTWPTQYYRLGVPKPTAAPVAALNVSGTIDTDFTTAYVYTYVTDWGEEGAPSAPSNTVTIVASDSNSLDVTNVLSPTGVNTNIVSARLYRVNVGDEAGEYQFVKEVDIATAVASGFNDNVNAFDLGEVISTEDFDNPPDNLTGIIQYSNGMYCAYVNNDIYFNEPFFPYAWPSKYRNNLPQTCKGLGSMGGSILVTTDGYPTLLNGSHPANMIATTLPYNKPNTSSRSVVSSKFGVTYSSPEGLFLIDNDTGTLLTDEIFSEEQWNTYDLDNLVGVFHNDKYYGFFDGSSAGIIYDFNNPDGITTFNITDYTYKYGYTDGTYLYVLVTNNTTQLDEIHSFETASTDLTFTWRSKIFQQLEALSFSACRILGTGTITLNMYINGDWTTPAFTKSNITMDGLFRLPSKRYKEVVIELTGTGYVDLVQFASSVKELG